VKTPKYIYLIILFLYLYISYVPTQIFARESGAAAKIFASIPGKFSLRIYGYTSPNSIVQAESVRVFAQTTTDRYGYFILNDVQISNEAKEICVSSIDSERRSSFPLCVTIPETDKPTEIGPLILAPTISFTGGGIWQNQKAFASGQTVPEKEVVVSFFEVPASSLSKEIEKKVAKFFYPTVEATSLPFLRTNSDVKGNFSFTLPTSRATAYRFFAKTIYEDAPSLKSHTLVFSIGSFIGYFLLYTLPKILTILIILLMLYLFLIWELKNKKARILLYRLKEKRLKPLEVRLHLKYQRLLYNLLRRWKSNRK